MRFSVETKAQWRPGEADFLPYLPLYLHVCLETYSATNLLVRLVLRRFYLKRCCLEWMHCKLPRRVAAQER